MTASCAEVPAALATSCILFKHPATSACDVTGAQTDCAVLTVSVLAANVHRRGTQAQQKETTITTPCGH
jgi:hypothetical protein